MLQRELQLKRTSEPTPARLKAKAQPNIRWLQARARLSLVVRKVGLQTNISPIASGYTEKWLFQGVMVFTAVISSDIPSAGFDEAVT